MSDIEKSQQGNGFLPPDKIKLMISLMLTKKYGNYQATVTALQSAYVGEDNIQEVQKIMKSVNAFVGDVDDHRKELKEPYLNYGRLIDAAHKEFVLPIIEAKDKVQVKLNEVAKAVAEKAEKERLRIEKETAIKVAINNFILDFSLKIASANTNEQLLGYERLINLEKANKSKYAEQLPLLIERCNELTDKIKDQKDLVREKMKLEQEKRDAEKAKDDEKLQELMNKQAELDEKIQENTILVQETASNSSIVQSEAENKFEAPTARRTTWKAEIFDEKEAVKKAKDLLDISLNSEKVRQSINTLKSAGVFTGKKEVIINGIRYYEEKTF